LPAVQGRLELGRARGRGLELGRYAVQPGIRVNGKHVEICDINI